MVEDADDPKPREWPLLLGGADVLAILAGAKAEHREAVDWRNSTVLGYPAKSYWPDLKWEHAVAREQSTLFLAMVGKAKAPKDIHLDVPWCHREDVGRFDGVEDMARYRVRPQWEVGDSFWGREKFLPCRGIGIFDSIDKATYVCFADGSQMFRNGNYHHDDAKGRAMNWPKGARFRSSTQMPRWASRLILEITDVAVERAEDTGRSPVGWDWVARFKRMGSGADRG